MEKVNEKLEMFGLFGTDICVPGDYWFNSDADKPCLSLEPFERNIR